MLKQYNVIPTLITLFFITINSITILTLKFTLKITLFKTYALGVSGGKKCLFFRNFGMLCFLETPVLRFALLPYSQRFEADPNLLDAYKKRTYSGFCAMKSSDSSPAPKTFSCWGCLVISVSSNVFCAYLKNRRREDGRY